MADHAVSKTVIVHKDDFAYISHASIAVMDGGWIASFTHSGRREPKMHPPQRSPVSHSAEQVI